MIGHLIELKLNQIKQLIHNKQRRKQMQLRALLIIAILSFVAVNIHCQPNTWTTVEVGIVNPQPQKTYLFFSDLKADSTQASVLIDGMDYLNPNVSDKITTLSNFQTIGDTLFGRFQIQDQEFFQYLKGGLVQVNDITTKYSAMTVTYWLETDMVEPRAGFFIRKINP